MIAVHDVGLSLRVLAILHYLAGIVMAVFSCVPILNAARVLFALHGGHRLPWAPPKSMSPSVVEAVAVCAAALGVFGWVIAALVLVAGLCVDRRRGYSFCRAVAVLSCVYVPHGTVLGILSTVVLSKPEVRAAFASR